MKVAIYETVPNAGGISIWSNQLQYGLTQLGHECDLVTFTRSGKPKSAWTPKTGPTAGTWWRHTPYDVVGKVKDAGTILDGYDLVILQDAKAPEFDKAAQQGKGYLDPNVPDYISVLKLTRTPFTFVLQGNNYVPREIPFVEQLLALPSFIGAAVAHSATCTIKGGDVWKPVDWVSSPLPYTMLGDGSDPACARRNVGITGRFNWTKGFHVLALAAGLGLIREGTNVDLHGGCPASRMPSTSFLVYEALTSTLGLHGARDADNPYHAYAWQVQSPTGDAITYNGAFFSGYSTCRSIGTHVSLTSSGFSQGLTEYAQLEAIDAGCALVGVSSTWNDELRGTVVPEAITWPGIGAITKKTNIETYVEPLARAVNEALAVSDHDRVEHARHNYEITKRLNDPSTVASRFIEIYHGN